METKVCTKCGRELPLNEFYNDKMRPDGKKSACRECTAQAQRDLRARKKDSETKSIIKNAPKVEEKTIKECNDCGLDKVPARLLVAELRRRGYRGELELVTIQKVVI
jgi:hypothetical protein